MRRLLSVAGAVALVAIGLAVAGGAAGGGESDGRRYTVELDNAFGLVEGGDVRVAGANAGRVLSLDLDRRTQKALVEVEITEEGFGSLRSDVFCESRPQSPIGEYFLDCLPGTSKREVEPGGRIPVEQTASTIPPDLIQNIMRRPYRERFRLILNEFGAGLAGRPEDLNAAIRRGVPALRQSARLLEVLARHRTVLRDLVTDADTVLARLSANRRNVGRFVVEAHDTSSASAERSTDIRTNFRKLPDFLEQLTPTMAALGEVAREQRPVLVDLDASAGELRRFFDDTAEFATVSRPAVRALGDAAVPGLEAVRAAGPNVRELRRYARPTPDLARNLRIVLEDFDDPSRAVERDPRSPGGRGYSGTEALLTYVFNQALTNNAFDELGYMVRTAAFIDKCGPYADAQTAKDPELADCRAWMGPNQVGVTTPDPSGDRPPRSASRTSDRRGASRRPAPPGVTGRAPAGGAPQGPGAPPPTGGLPTQGVTDLLDGILGGAPEPPPGAGPAGPRDRPAPRLPARPVTRRPSTSLVASPALVGAVTVLVTIVAVFLAYNANNGLPFAPTLEVKVRAENSAALTKGSEVREGGIRIGFVRTIRSVRLPDGRAGAEMAVSVAGSAGDLPVDTSFTIRPRSPLGLKYLEMVRGGSRREARDGHVFPPRQTTIPVQLDDFTRQFDDRTRVGIRREHPGLRHRARGRGASVNRTLEVLPRLFARLEPVARNLSDRRTRLGRSFAEIGDTVRVLSPLAAVQADLFTRTAQTFEAISRDTGALKRTISNSHPAFQAGIDSFPVQRPFLTDSAALARETRPVARLLRPTLPEISDALETRHPRDPAVGGLLRGPRAHPGVAARADARSAHRDGPARTHRKRDLAGSPAALPRALPDGLQLLELLLHLPRRDREPAGAERLLPAGHDQEHRSAEQQLQLDGRGRAGQRRGLQRGLTPPRRPGAPPCGVLSARHRTRRASRL